MTAKSKMTKARISELQGIAIAGMQVKHAKDKDNVFATIANILDEYKPSKTEHYYNLFCQFLQGKGCEFWRRTPKHMKEETK